MLVVFFLSVISQLFFDLWLTILCGEKKIRIKMDVVVSGAIISLLLSPCVPYWGPVLVSFITSVVEFIQSGLKIKIFNPLAFGYCTVAAFFSKHLEIFAAPHTPLSVSSFFIDSDSVKGTILAVESLVSENIETINIFDILFGNRAGTIGELSIFLLVCVSVYLIVRRTITWHIPVAFLAVAGLVYIVFPQSPVSVEYMIYQLFDGMTITVAIFLASSYGATPVTSNGKLLFGACCGFLTAVFRTFFGGYSAAAYSVIIMNPFAVIFDRLTCPDAFGNIFLRAKKRAERVRSHRVER